MLLGPQFKLVIELYGFKGIDADIEVIVLMLSSLKLLDISTPTLSLGNTAIFNALCDLLIFKTMIEMLLEIFSEESHFQIE